MKFLTALSLTLICSQIFADVVTAPMKPENWTREPTALNYAGREAFLLQGGAYVLKDVKLTNGRISVDIFTPGQRGFVGMVFRTQDSDGELFYLRPHKTRLPDTIQYTPIFNGLSGWQLYYDERYLATAEIPYDRWVTYTLEFINQTLKIYVDNDPEPVLETTSKQDTAPGEIGIWGNNAGLFSNFRYEDLGEQDSNVASQKEIPADGVIKNWQVSQRFSAKDQSSLIIPENLEFSQAMVEDQGFVNVSRYHPRGQDKALVYAKTNLSAETAKTIKLWFGYSDEVTVFLNGKPQFQGNSSFNTRAPFSLGLLDDDHDAIYLDLEPGDNELIFAVSETFGGWGFMGRIEP